MDVNSQHGFGVRFDWGPVGMATLAPVSDVIVIVDVLSFTTSVDIVVAKGGSVIPYPFDDGGEATYAAEHGAMLATRRGQAESSHHHSLSPASLVDFPRGGEIVMPSPNGSTLCFGAEQAGASTVFAGCLRNATAVAHAAAEAAGAGGSIGVIASGERWRVDGSPLRAAVEDMLGAGAIISAISDRSWSPEARAAAAAFADAAPDLLEVIVECASGRELFEMRRDDPPLAAQHDVSPVAPRLDGIRLRA